MSLRVSTRRASGRSVEAGTHETLPLGSTAHFQSVKGLINHAPGRKPLNRLFAPWASIMALEPLGRFGCRSGNSCSAGGTGSSSTEALTSPGPWRPSIHSTFARACSGISSQGTPAEVVESSFLRDIKNPPAVIHRGGLVSTTRLVAHRPHPLSGTTLPGRAGWRGQSPALDAGIKLHLAGGIIKGAEAEGMSVQGTPEALLGW